MKKVIAAGPQVGRRQTAELKTPRASHAVYDTRFAFDYYRPLQDTRILWRGRISVCDHDPDDIARLLRRDLVRVYPQLADVQVDYAWGGLMS